MECFNNWYHVFQGPQFVFYLATFQPDILRSEILNFNLKAAVHKEHALSAARGLKQTIVSLNDLVWRW